MPPELWTSSSNGSQIGNSTSCAMRFDPMRADVSFHFAAPPSFGIPHTTGMRKSKKTRLHAGPTEHPADGPSVDPRRGSHGGVTRNGPSFKDWSGLLQQLVSDEVLLRIELGAVLSHLVLANRRSAWSPNAGQWCREFPMESDTSCT